MVLFVYREEYYLLPSEPEHPVPGDPQDKFDKYNNWVGKMDPVKGISEVIVAKQRHGATGKVKLRFESKITRFSDYKDDSYLPEARG